MKNKRNKVKNVGAFCPAIQIFVEFENDPVEVIIDYELIRTKFKCLGVVYPELHSTQKKNTAMRAARSLLNDLNKS